MKGLASAYHKLPLSPGGAVPAHLKGEVSSLGGMLFPGPTTHWATTWALTLPKAPKGSPGTN